MNPNSSRSLPPSNLPLYLSKRLKACSSGFRDLFYTLSYPNSTKIEFMRASAFLLFSNWRDGETGYLIMCKDEVVRWFEGDNGRKPTSIDSAEGEFLSEIKKMLPDFEYSGYATGRCRVVLNRGFSDEIMRALSEELGSPPSRSDRVDFITGKKITTKLRTSILDAKAHDAEARTVKDLAHIQPLLRHLNDLAPNAFTSMVKRHKEEAYALYPRLVDRVVEKHRDKAREVYERSLATVCDHPKPFYKSSEAGARVYPIGDTFGTLHKDLRRVFMRGYYDYDLRNSQFSINSVLWGVPEVEEYLRSGESIWDELIPHVFPGLSDELRPSAKGAIKHLAYGYLYGMGHRTGRKVAEGEIETNPELYDVLGENAPRDLLSRFRSHPFIEMMIQARDRRLEEILRHGGWDDAFGNRIPVETYTNSEGKERDTARSILALVSQSYETSLLLPVFEYIKGESERVTSPLRLTLWQHDGFSTSKRLKLDLINELLGDRYPTILECEPI